MGQHPPGAARSGHVEQCVHDLTHVLCPWSATVFLLRDEGLHDHPLFVGQIRRVVFAHGDQYPRLSELFKHALITNIAIDNLVSKDE